MDTTTSSVLSEANNSLMAGNSLPCPKMEDNRAQNVSPVRLVPDLDQVHSLSTNKTAYDNHFTRNYYTGYSSATMTQEAYNSPIVSTKSSILTTHQNSLPSLYVQATDMSSPPAASHVESNADICQSFENVPSLYSSIARIIASAVGFQSPHPNDGDQLDESLFCSRSNNSRSNTPSSSASVADRTDSSSRQQHPAPIFLDYDKSTLYECPVDQHLELSESHNYMNQSHHNGASHLSSNNIQGDFLNNRDLSPVRHLPFQGYRNTQDLNGFSNSLDGFEFPTDNVKYEETDINIDQYPRSCSSASQQHLQVPYNNSRSSVSPSVSISTPIPSPSSSSQAADDSTQSSFTDNAYQDCSNYEHNPGLPQDNDGAMKIKAGKSKEGFKPRGAQNLPPCRVCGNMASGLHFGVNTCEACNEFFRRSLKRGAAYYCSKNRECQVYGKKRNACSFCRYQRCVEMGMSRNAIKTGRYSHKTRTEYAMEVEKVKLREVSRAESEKYEVLISDLVKYHDKYVKATTRVPEEELLVKQAAYLELYHTQQERHPPLRTTVPNKRLLEGWMTQREDLSLTMHDAEMTEQWLRNYINFAKNVPGFKELALSDQASLVKGSWFEFWFLGAFKGYNSTLNVVIYPIGRCFHRDEIQKVFGKEYTDFSFYLADRMRSLEVSPEVMVLIKTVCLTFPDRSTLDNKEAVDKMHWSMVSCLLHTLDKMKTGGRTILPLVVSKLVELRTLTEIAMQAHKSALFQDVLKESPLLCEMVDTKTRYVQSAENGVQPVPDQV